MDHRDIRNRIGKRLIVADGSTGTALQALAPEKAPRAPLLPLEEPALVESLHRAYFDAGSDLVESATFTASERGIAGLLSRGVVPAGGSADPSDIAYRVNRAGAEAAVRARLRAEAATGRPRWVAGSIGPGDESPSLGGSSWARIRDSYLPQARGLADGGADLAIVETCQDPIQIKAALAALARPDGGRGLPFIVSATVDGRGRMLAGTGIAALVAVVAPFGPLAIGLNCSGGPDELEAPLAELASLSPFPLCFMPNAGLPAMEDGKPVWPLDAGAFAAKVEALARRYGVAVIGGCCGTAPAHIAELARRLSDRPVPPSRPERRPALASLYEARPIGPGLFRIGGLAGAAGGADPGAALDRGDLDALAEMASDAEYGGAPAVDLRLSRPGRDEAADLATLVASLAPVSRAALFLDSEDPAALEAALPLIGGRALVGPARADDPARARRILSLAREHGAAAVCAAAAGGGRPPSAETSARAARALYDIAVGEIGLGPGDLLFDCSAPAPDSGSCRDGSIEPSLGESAAAACIERARESLRALRLVAQSCAGSATLVRGDFPLPDLPAERRAEVAAAYLELAREAGLAAIVDGGPAPEPTSADPERVRAARDLLLGGRGDAGAPGPG